ncbi:MAG: OmpA family protein [Alphaproteobacteria bacterium]|nr:OmpA family protein [Alphaproteobacteria bacterium]
MLPILVSTAAAQDFVAGETPTVNAQTFRPTVHPLHTLWVDEVGSKEDPAFHADALFHYTNDPLVYRFDDGEVLGLVTDVLQADVLAGGGFGPVRLGLQLPIYLYQVGIEQRSGGLGDIGLDGRVTALDPADFPVGISVGGRMWVPTTTVANSLGNQGQVAYEITASADGEAGPVLLALNVGTRGGPLAELENLTLNDGFLVRAAAIGMIDELTGVGLETHAVLPYSATLDTPGATDWEWLASGYRRVSDWQFRGGFGSGLTHGIGSPDFRLMLGVGWNLPGEEPVPPPPPIVDTDGDGIMDPDDACVSVPEDLDGFQDTDGCPDPDDDGDGILDAADACRMEPEDLDGVRDEDGCPEPEVAVAVRVVDPTGARIDVARTLLQGGGITSTGGAEQMLELGPGNYALDASAVGFDPVHEEIVIADAAVVLDVTLTPAAKPGKIVVTRERIDLKESIQFETASAKIKSASNALLEEVATVLRDYPEIRVLRIDGHTDSRGSDTYNLELSKQRAASVRQWLIDHGIEADRLKSEGYGESRPLDDRNNAEAWAKNRRVEMTIEEWADKTP